MYVASQLGLQDEYDTQIIKSVWNNDSDMSNMTAQKASDSCEIVYESQGSDAYNKCYNAALSCGSDTNCNALAVKYSQALAKGYSKDFESFKKKSSFMSNAGEISGGIISGLLASLGGGNEDRINVGGGYYEAPPKSKTGLYIGIGAVALIGIGAVIYFARKKK
jgi:hypothetical protein